MQAASADVRDALNEGGRSGIGSRRQGRVRRQLVFTEVALALVLLIGSGLLIRSFMKLRQVDIGFMAQNILTMRVPLPQAKYPFPNPPTDLREPAGLAFYDELLTRVRGLGECSAVAATVLPLGAGEGWGKFVSIEGRTETSLEKVPLVRFAQISQEYFKTFGVTVREGRSLQLKTKGTRNLSQSLMKLWRVDTSPTKARSARPSGWGLQNI